MSINSFRRLKSVESMNRASLRPEDTLVIFPNGNKNRDVKDHISLYLEMGGDKPIEPEKIVTIDYKLFVLNRHKGKESYLVLKDSNKKEKKYCVQLSDIGGLAGFDRFIPLEEFSDAPNGYLIDESCEFGAEIFVSETTRRGKGECLFMNLSTTRYKHVWKITRFSKLGDQPYYSPFISEDKKYCTWRLKLYPKGKNSAKGSRLSLFLGFYEPYTLLPGSKILVEFTLRILEQIHGSHCSYKSTGRFIVDPTRRGCDRGYKKMISKEANSRLHSLG